MKIKSIYIIGQQKFEVVTDNGSKFILDKLPEFKHEYTLNDFI